MPRIGILLTVWCWLATSVAAACPFCPPSSPTLAEQLAGSDVAALVKWNQATRSADQSEAQTEFIVIEALRRIEGAPDRGDSITVPYLVESKPGDLFVMLGKQGEATIDYSLPIEITEISYGYLKQAPPPERPATERLPYFLKFLEFSDPTIANDAFAEFSRSPYEDVRAIRDQLSRKTVRRWIDELEASEQLRLGFYGLLLGLCGNADDAAYLAGRILPPTPADQVRLGLDGMMAGYVLLTGDEGLQTIVDKKLNAPDQPDGDVYAAINTLRFLWEFASERVSRNRVESAMATLINRPAFAEVAIVDLARWGHWRIMDDVAAMYGQPPFDEPFPKHKLIQFALACVKADDKTPDTPIPEAARARQFLEQLQQTDPETLHNARRFFGGRPSLSEPAPTP